MITTPLFIWIRHARESLAWIERNILTTYRNQLLNSCHTNSSLVSTITTYEKRLPQGELYWHVHDGDAIQAKLRLHQQLSPSH